LCSFSNIPSLYNTRRSQLNTTFTPGQSGNGHLTYWPTPNLALTSYGMQSASTNTMGLNMNGFITSPGQAIAGGIYKRVVNVLSRLYTTNTDKHCKLMSISLNFLMSRTPSPSLLSYMRTRQNCHRMALSKGIPWLFDAQTYL
jgi:hypothetical protein